ncbi:DNA polymerase III subunit delta [Deltaproteobacteria bacterium OttesenSCG-928-K17]|nr:DNA polymerase III subunit delta [Deltaproteobacteria bacterium OttesenSCG-928-K17]
MTPAAFIKEIQGSGRKALYLISGGESSATNKCLAAAESAVGEDFRDFNYKLMDLEAGQAGRLINEAFTMPFFAPPRVVAVKNPPFNGDDWNALADYLESPNSSSTIILTLAKPDARLKFFKKVKSIDAEVDCAPPKGAALNKWLIAEFAARGVKADGPACAMIIDRAGSDPETLSGEAEKLSLYLGQGGALTAETVRALVSLAPNANVFELGDALGGGNLKSALANLMDLMAVEHHLPILAMMVRQFRLMLQVKTRQAELGLRRLGRDEAATLKMNPFVMDKIQTQAAGWSWADLKSALTALEEAHRAIVTTATPPELILQNLAVSLAGKFLDRR